jgi:tetratricopeptide (TPR) repeat protein
MFDPMISRVMASAAAVVVAAILAGSTGEAAGPSADALSRLAALEPAVAADSENLIAAADYRQLAIAAGAYDRSIKLFERLSRRPTAGAHAYLNLALAYVDKVPTVGALRQLYLGRDAIAALTRSIEREPTALAYLVRGVINLYYDALIFHRVAKGVADLEQAQRLSAIDGARPYVARIFIALGDGYWRLDQPAHAREVWRSGLERFADNDLLRARVSAADNIVRGLIAHSLDPDIRVDTSLRDVFTTAPSVRIALGEP